MQHRSVPPSSGDSTHTHPVNTRAQLSLYMGGTQQHIYPPSHQLYKEEIICLFKLEVDLDKSIKPKCNVNIKIYLHLLNKAVSPTLENKRTPQMYYNYLLFDNLPIIRTLEFSFSRHSTTSTDFCRHCLQVIEWY